MKQTHLAGTPEHNAKTTTGKTNLESKTDGKVAKQSR